MDFLKDLLQEIGQQLDQENANQDLSWDEFKKYLSKDQKKDAGSHRPGQKKSKFVDKSSRGKTAPSKPLIKRDWDDDSWLDQDREQSSFDTGEKDLKKEEKTIKTIVVPEDGSEELDELVGRLKGGEKTLTAREAFIYSEIFTRKW